AESGSALDTEDAEDIDEESEVDTVDEDAEESEEDSADEEEPAPAKPVGFWGEVGIDPIKIIVDGAQYHTLRCYLDDEPIFLGSEGKIDVFGSPRALAKYLAHPAEDGNDLTEVSTWAEVATKATDGSLKIEVDLDNTYVLDGLAEDLGGGPDTVDPVQLDLA